MADPSPALYPLQWRDTAAGVLELGEADYRAAAFLDGRLLAGGRALAWRPAAELLDALPEERRAAHLIFHTGHVGSTLLSRLLGEHPALFSVREPALLREAATGGGGPDIATLLRLFSRTWRDGQTAVIKATSFVSEIGPALMAAGGGGRAILLATTPPVYLRTILAGPASREECATLSPLRRERLERRLGATVEAEGDGEEIALAWLCEAGALHAIAAATGPRCLPLDFDRWLAEPVAGLRRVFSHLGVAPDGVDAPALCRGPLMQRYSKAPEHAYDAELRRQVLAEAGRTEAGEVRRGMDWLQRMAGAHPLVLKILLGSVEAARATLAGPTPAA